MIILSHVLVGWPAIKFLFKTLSRYCFTVSSTSHCCWEVWFHYDSYFLLCASLSPLMFLGFLFHPVDPKILPQHLLQKFIHCALIEVLHMETYMLHFSLSHNAFGNISPYCFLFSLPEVPVCQILDLLDWSIIFLYFLCSSLYFLWYFFNGITQSFYWHFLVTTFNF